jgi:gamma-glutamyltranspeptidase / glutathione hydrolase
MSPVIVTRNGKPIYALGLPGGLRIFPSVMQALSNLIDHGMTIQQAVEAPRVWTQGHTLELEGGIAQDVFDALLAKGHDAVRTGNVAGGMSAIHFHDDGTMEGAACWRADGTPIALGGGLARPGVRFRPEAGPSQSNARTVRSR